MKLLIKYRKNFLTMIPIVTHNGSKNGDIHRNLKYCIQNSKTSLKTYSIS